MKNLKHKRLLLFLSILIIIGLVSISGREFKENKNNVGVIEKITSNIKVDSSKFIPAEVVRIVDGDTMIASINGIEERVRFIGINTPESTIELEDYGKEASDYTTSKLKKGSTVYLEKDISQRDKFDRLLRYVWLSIPTSISEDELRDKLFNANLLINGYAEVATYPPDLRYVDDFIKFEKEARSNKVGLWD